MNYTIDRNEAFSLGAVPTTDTGVVVAYLSVDLHQDNSIIAQAAHHLYPDALLSGAGHYTREQFLHAVNILGASIETGITNGILTISVRATDLVFPKVLKLLMTMLTEPTFAAGELARIRTTVTNELHIKQEEARIVAHEAFCNQLYGPSDRRHTASYSDLSKALVTVKAPALAALHQHMLSCPWTVTIAGATSDVDAFRKLITAIKRDKTVATIVGSHEQRLPKPTVQLHDIPSRSNVEFSIGVPIPITLHHPDHLPLVFALGVLAIPGFAGRLMNTVRNKEGLTYMIYGSLDTFSGSEQGYARIATFFTPQQSQQGLTSTFRELHQFYERGISAAEFSRFTRIFKTKQTLLKDSLIKQTLELHFFNQNGFSVDEIALYKAKLDSLTRPQINAVIKKYLNPDRFIISGAGPTSAHAKVLAAFAKPTARRKEVKK